MAMNHAWKLYAQREVSGVHGVDVAVAAFAEKLQLALPVVVEKIATDLHTRIVRRNPVDTGFSRSRWRVAEGAPSTEQAPADIGEALPLPPPAFPSMEFSGKAPVFITNDADYIIYLEAGSSNQAPGGMVMLSIAETVAEIEGTLAELEDK